MQSKTTMRFHLMPVRMAKTKEITGKQCCRGLGGKGIFTHRWRGSNWYSHYGNKCGESLKKVKAEDSTLPSYPTLWHVLNRPDILLLKCSPKHVHRCSTHKSQGMCTQRPRSEHLIIRRAYPPPWMARLTKKTTKIWCVYQNSS